MLFHVGALMRLNEVGLLRRLDRVSSVSGGSIAAGVLASRWESLDFGTDGVAANFDGEVVQPLREFAGRTIDWPAVVRGPFMGGSAGNRVAASYRRHLFGARTLRDLPAEPSFVINATSLQSGALWRFTRDYMADYRVGIVREPELPLATAVAASSAFPPFLSPLRLKLRESDFEPGSGEDLQQPPYTQRAVLSDGGVYDNLGLEAAFKDYRSVLISDGGGYMAPQKRPWTNWPLQLLRVTSVIDNQVRALRKREAIEDYESSIWDGAYWGIRTDIANYELADALPADHTRTLALANVATRLGKLKPRLQEQIINWGYAVSDAAVRKHFDTELPAPHGFPYPASGI